MAFLSILIMARETLWELTQEKEKERQNEITLNHKKGI